MHAIWKPALALTGVLVATQAFAEITFYSRDNMSGRSFTTERQVRNLERFGFNDRASSAVVGSGRWEVCEGQGFTGRCVVLRRGEYPSLAAMGLENSISSVRASSRSDGDRPRGPASITFYGREGFVGRSFQTERQVGNLERFGFNDRASSAVVRGDSWEVCDDVRFSGKCVVLRPGRYSSLAAMGLDNRVTSARAVNDRARIDGDRIASPRR
jgi:hypothetical protein